MIRWRAGAAVVEFDAIFSDQSRADYRAAAELQRSLFTLGLANPDADGEGEGGLATKPARRQPRTPCGARCDRSDRQHP